MGFSSFIAKTIVVSVVFEAEKNLHKLCEDVLLSICAEKSALR